MELDKNTLTQFTLVDATIRGIDAELQILQLRADQLGVERKQAEEERENLYLSIGLDSKQYVLIANKKTTDQTGKPLAYGKIFDRSTGAEYDAQK